MVFLQLDVTALSPDKYWVFMLLAAIAFVALLGAVYFFYVHNLKKRFVLPQLPPGSLLLVEGPIDTHKEVVCGVFLKGVIDNGGKGALISSNLAADTRWFETNLQKERFANLRSSAAVRDLTDLSVNLSDALGWGASVVYMPILSVMLVDSALERVIEFIRGSAEKARQKGAYLIFTVNPDATAKASVSSIELLADYVVEFKCDGGEFVRVKKSPTSGPDMDWRPA